MHDSEILNNAIGILPVEFVQPASRAARLWCLVRSHDHPDNGGQGSGLLSIDMCELIVCLNRSGRSVYRYLKAAKQQGFLHWYRVEGERVTLKYCSLERVARRLELKTIGAVVSFPLDQIQHAKAIAAEGQAEALQAQSWHQKQKEWGKYAKGQPKASEILTESASAKVAGVLVARGKRLAYLGPNWRRFGGSQRTIADRLGVSIRTIQNRLSHSWREERGMNPLAKAQTAYQVFEDYDLGMIKALYSLTEDANQKWIRLGRRLFERGTNIYQTQCRLRSFKCRKAFYLDPEGAKHAKPAGGHPLNRLMHSFSLYAKFAERGEGLRVFNLSMEVEPGTRESLQTPQKPRL